MAVVQFIKGKWKTGERLFAATLSQLTFLTMGDGFTWEGDAPDVHALAARAAWERDPRRDKHFLRLLDRDRLHRLAHCYTEPRTHQPTGDIDFVEAEDADPLVRARRVRGPGDLVRAGVR